MGGTAPPHPSAAYSRETQVKQGDGVMIVRRNDETISMTEAQRDLSLALARRVGPLKERWDIADLWRVGTTRTRRVSVESILNVNRDSDWSSVFCIADREAVDSDDSERKSR